MEELTDTERMDILASFWDSQSEGAFICGRWVANPTGSFREAIDAFEPNPVHPTIAAILEQFTDPKTDK